MKIGFCSVSFREENIGLKDIIKIVASTGYDSIEIWSNHLIAEEVDYIREAVAEHGLSVSMFSPYFNFTDTKKEWLESIENAKKIIEYADRLNSPLVRVFTGVLGSAEATQEQYQNCVDGIRKVAEMADDKGISLAIETHPRTLVDDVDSSARLIESVNRSNVGLNLDIYHLFEVVGDPVGIFKRLKDVVFHIHAKNAHLSDIEKKENPHLFLHDLQAKQRFYGIAYLKEGDMPYDDFLKEVKKSKFSGCVSVEWFGENPREAAVHELQYLRKFIS
jgi:3-dehydroshikimate dehydratase